MEMAQQVTQRHPLEINTSGQEVKIIGALSKDSVLHAGAERKLREVSKFNRVIIDASYASVFEGGADVWIGLVREYLRNCKIHYRSSQLGLILLYNDRYRKMHPASVFDEEED